MPLINNKNLIRLLQGSALLLLLSGCQQMAAVIPEPPPPPVTVQTAAEKANTPETQPKLAPPIEEKKPELKAESCVETPDLWTRVRNGFLLERREDGRVRSDIEWYSRHQSYLDRVSERARPYLHLIIEEVEARGMPGEIALLPVVESAYQPFAYSHGRAAGLWQFIPGTGRRFGLKQTWWYDGRRDILKATNAALDYLSYLHRHFDGDWLLALAAYNSGEGTVARAIRRNKKKGKPADFWSLDLPPETEGYVPKLLAIATIVDNPVAHGVTLETIPDEPYLSTVEVGSQIDLDLAAELAGISIEELYRYNPAFNRWATDPAGPHHLLLPLSQAEMFMQRLEQYPEKERISWKRHRVRSGESLGVIARDYRTTISMIKKVNGIRGNTIRAGQSLTIPVARKELNRYQLSSSERLKRTQNQKRQGSRIDYRVKPGDTLWDIAQEYSVSVNSLAKWNGMAPRDPLKPGKQLVIWTSDKKQISAINPANFTHPYQTNTRQRIGYTVRSGDSLSRISQRFKVSIDSLKRWNNLQGKKYLQPGQKLTLYVDVTHQSGSI